LPPGFAAPVPSLAAFPNFWDGPPGRGFAGGHRPALKRLEYLIFHNLARLVLWDRHSPGPARFAKETTMTTSKLPVYAREHTLLGVCEALGEDFGFNPLFLRVPLAVCLLLNPLAVIAAYAALGLLVLVSRRLIPNPTPAAMAESAEAAPLEGGNDRDEEMALAA